MRKLNKFAYILLSIAFVAGVLPRAVIAWQTAQSAQSECSSENTAIIKVSFTNKEKTKSMNVEAKDEQSGKNTNLGAIEAGKTKSGEINTGKDSISDGTATFLLTWTDGNSGSDKRSAQYKAISCTKPNPTPTATPEPTPTATPVPTSTPMPTPTTEPTPTSTPEPTITPSPTAVPTVTPTPTNAPVVTIVNNNTNNNTNNNNTYVQTQPATAPQVLAAVDVKELPKTGVPVLSLLGLLSLFPLGIFLRSKSA